MTFLTQGSGAGPKGLSSSQRLAVAVLAVLTLWLGSQALAAAQGFVISARVGMLTKFSLDAVRFDPASREITAVVSAVNPSDVPIVLEDLRISIYSGSTFIFTNVESQFDRAIVAGGREAFELSLVLEPHFADQISVGTQWHAFGRAYLKIPAIRPKIPVRLDLFHPAAG